jgi:hypothetical protein
MRAVKVYCECEERQFTEIFQGIIIDKERVLVFGDEGLIISGYRIEDKQVVVDTEVERVFLSLNFQKVPSPDNLEAAKIVDMTFIEFINYLASWKDDFQHVEDLQVNDYVYVFKERCIERVTHVYPNGTMSNPLGELTEASGYSKIEGKEDLALIDKLVQSIQTKLKEEGITK